MNDSSNDATPYVNPEGERLQKVMAAAGVASRRVCEDLIAAGRVAVNGIRVEGPGRRVLPTDLVSVDGKAIQLDTTKLYIMLNKPVGIVSSLFDDRGRPDLRRYTNEFQERLFNVGRLDAQTSGLLILTNDGELAHILAHPSFGVLKTYIAKVEGVVTQHTVNKLVGGIELEDGLIEADKARIIGTPSNDETVVEVTLHSGRNRIVRRMLEEVGHPVIDLVRRQFGPLHLGSLAPDAMRDLTKDEVGELLTIARGSKGTKIRSDAAERSDGSHDSDNAGYSDSTDPRNGTAPEPSDD